MACVLTRVHLMLGQAENACQAALRIQEARGAERVCGFAHPGRQSLDETRDEQDVVQRGNLFSSAMCSR